MSWELTSSLINVLSALKIRQWDVTLIFTHVNVSSGAIYRASTHRRSASNRPFWGESARPCLAQVGMKQSRETDKDRAARIVGPVFYLERLYLERLGARKAMPDASTAPLRRGPQPHHSRWPWRRPQANDRATARRLRAVRQAVSTAARFRPVRAVGLRSAVPLR